MIKIYSSHIKMTTRSLNTLPFNDSLLRAKQWSKYLSCFSDICKFDYMNLNKLLR